MKPIDAIRKGATLKQVLQRIEKDVITEALEGLGWNYHQTALFLAITRQGLTKKIERLGIKCQKTTRRLSRHSESVAYDLATEIVKRLRAGEGSLYFFRSPPQVLATENIFLEWNADTFSDSPEDVERISQFLAAGSPHPKESSPFSLASSESPEEKQEPLDSPPPPPPPQNSIDLEPYQIKPPS